MDQYKNFSVEEFVGDARFRSWVRKPTRNEDNFWQKVIEAYPSQETNMAMARAIVLAIHPVDGDDISESEIEGEIETILNGIPDDPVISSQAKPEHGKRKRRYIQLAAAASVALLLVAGYIVQPLLSLDPPVVVDLDRSSQQTERYMIERVNKSATALLISLPDQSSVLLSANSRLRYPSRFSDSSRSVFLEGTAFFEVTKNPEVPFYVNAGKIVAKVLGTSFEINTGQSGKEISVTVKSGTVSIYSNLEKSEDEKGREPDVILTQHEQFVFRDALTQVQHTRLDSASLRSMELPDTYLTFNATLAAEAFDALARAYQVHIDYERAIINDCSVTARFEDEPFTTKLDLICRSIGVTYEIVNDRVTITGEGCAH